MTTRVISPNQNKIYKPQNQQNTILADIQKQAHSLIPYAQHDQYKTSLMTFATSKDLERNNTNHLTYWYDIIDKKYTHQHSKHIMNPDNLTTDQLRKFCIDFWTIL